MRIPKYLKPTRVSSLNRCTRWLAAGLVTLLSLLGAFALKAGTVTWTGGGANANWTTALNWTPGVPNPSDVLVFDGSTQTSTVNDFAPGTDFGGILFPATAGAFSLEGNAIGLGGLVQNNSSTVQTIGVGLNLTNLTIFDAAAGDLAVTNAVTLATNVTNYVLTKTGANRMDLYWDWWNSASASTVTVSNGWLAVNAGTNSNNFNALVNWNPRFVLSGGSLLFQCGSYWSALSVTCTTNSTVGVDTGFSIAYAGTLGSPGYSITKTGAGTINTTYWATNQTVMQASSIVVAEGTLSDAANNYGSWGNNYWAQWGTGPISVLSGASLIKNDGGIVLNPITLPGGLGMGNGALIVGQAGAPAASNSTCLATFYGPVTLQADTTIGVTFGKALFTGNIVGAGGFEKIGGGIMALGGNNTYGGQTMVTTGMVQIASTTALPATSTVSFGTGGGLDLNGFNTSANNGLTDLGDGTSVVDNTSANPATLTVGGNSQPVSLTGPVKNSGGGALSIVKVGTGAATLLGANKYSGSNVVTAGKLEINIPNGPASNGLIAVSDGAELSVHKTVAGAAFKSPSMTLGASGAVTLDIDLGNFGSPAIAPFTITNGAGTLAVGGAVTVNIGGNANLMQSGRFPLIRYTARSGNGSFVLGMLPPNLTATLVTNASGKSIDLNISSSPVAIWVGNVSGDWDINTTLNWSVLGAPSKYQDGVGVLFGDGSATNYINLTTSVAPGGVLVSANTNYTFDGAGGIINCDIAKNGSGTLTMLTANTYFNTTISGGTLQIGNGGTGGTLGSGNIQNDATLVIIHADLVDIPYPITGAGTIIQAGTGLLSLSAANSFAGGAVVNAGTLRLNNATALGVPAGSTAAATVASGATLDLYGQQLTMANPVIISGSGVAANQGALMNGSGSYEFWATSHGLRLLRLAADATIGNDNANLCVGNGGGGIDGRGFNLVKVGGNRLSIMSSAVSAPGQFILGAGSVCVQAQNPFGTGALLVVSNNAYFDSWANNAGGPVTYTVANNIVVGPGGAEIRNSNGHWWSTPDNDIYSGAITLNDNLTVLNSSVYNGLLGRLTLSGAISGSGGVIKNGPYLVTLSGANAYKGPTTVNVGALAISSASQGGGAYTVNDGAMLDVPGQGAYITVPMSSLTVGSSTGSVLVLTRMTTLSTSNAPITATNLTLIGQCSLLAPGFAFTTPGQYPLIKYSGSVGGGGSFALGGAVRGVPGYISNNVANSSIDLVVVAGSSPVAWVGNVNDVWDINSTANFTYQGSATTYQQSGASGDAVTFDDTGLQSTVNIAAQVSPAILIVSNANKNYTFTNSTIVGTTALLKEGPGALFLNNGANTFAGGATIAGGTIKLGNDGSLNNVSGTVTIEPGATLDMNTYNPSALTINASGSGVGGKGAIVDNAANLGNTRGPGTINMLGDLWIGGTNRWSMRNGAATLTCPTNNYTLYKVGPNMVDFSGCNVSANLGDLVILGGTFSHRNANAGGMGSLAYKVKVGAGATLDFNTTPPPNLKTVVCSNTATIALSSSGITVANPIVLDSGTVTFNANYNNKATFTNVISGAGGVVFGYNSQITFSAPNTYSGITEVTTGPQTGPASYLQLSGNGSIADSTSIYLHGNGWANFPGGAVLDASTRTDGTFTLSNGQTFRGDTGSSIKGNVVAGLGSTVWPGGPSWIQAMTFSNALTFQGGSTCAIDINTDTGTNDLVIVGGTLTMNGTLALTHLGASPYAGGQSFKLFYAGTFSGAFTNITPATPGHGMVWDTSALATSGVLKVIGIGAIQPPYIGPGNQLVLAITNTMVGRNYVLYSATNLAPPVIWAPVLTNAGTGGNITNTIPIAVTTPDEFFQYRMQ